MAYASKGLNPNSKAYIEAKIKQKPIFVNNKMPVASYEDEIDNGKPQPHLPKYQSQAHGTKPRSSLSLQ